ncbi:MAG: hypothetical protein AAF387_22360 [Pseudomonadota bacterium]
MAMPVSVGKQIFWAIAIFACVVAAEENNLLELFEFLGEWTDEDGTMIDFDMLDEISESQSDASRGNGSDRAADLSGIR